MIKDNKEPSEFEIQAEAFMSLKDRFQHVRGEYHFRNPETGKRSARFDIAILSPTGELRVVVEVKKRNRKRSWAQATRYGTITGRPVLYIRGMEQAQHAVSLVLQHLKDMHLAEEYLR